MIPEQLPIFLFLFARVYHYMSSNSKNEKLFLCKTFLDEFLSEILAYENIVELRFARISLTYQKQKN